MKRFLAVIEGSPVIYKTGDVSKTLYMNPTTLIVEAYSLEEAESELYRLLNDRCTLSKTMSEPSSYSQLTDLIKSDDYLIKGLTEIY